MLKLNIKKYRLEKKITQEELALRCELTQAYISNLERNTIPSKNPTLKILENISNALQVCPKELIDCCDNCHCKNII